MTLRNLQVFLTIAELGNMTKAAEKLFISQPSVSLAISEIEKTYNVTLFERLPGKLKLTPTGEKLRQYAKKMLDVEQDMEKFLSQESSNYCVRIGATITVGNTVISSVIADARSQLPKINYHVEIDGTKEIEQKLLDGKLDIAIVEGKVDNPSLEVKSFIEDNLVAICSLDNPFASRDSITLKDLSGVPLILRDEGSGTREQFMKAVNKSGIDAVVRFSSISYGAIIDAVEHDLGIGIISERLAKKHVSEGGKIHICHIDGVNLSRNFKLIYRKDRYVTDILETFLHILWDSEPSSEEPLLV